jgi:putative membrane protein
MMERFHPKILFFTAISAPAWMATSAPAQPGRYGGGMMGPGYHGFWGMGWLGLLFWGLVLVAVVLAIRWLWQAGRGKDSADGTRRAMDILSERYARGEIGKEEFERMKKDIEA